MLTQDIIKNWDGIWWQISPKRTDDYSYIFCPEMEKTGHDHRIIIKGYREFKRLESYLKDTGQRGWTACSKIEHPHIVKLMARLGAQPFHCEKEDDHWYINFVKHFKE